MARDLVMSGVDAVAAAIRLGDTQGLRALIESLAEELPAREVVLARQTVFLVDDGDRDLAADLWSFVSEMIAVRRRAC